ncbi:hypothetical protein Taro_027117 [Colocasia esculenta]|uniref:Histone-lysine N-methyltransferase SUVR4 n=1 Tax=Colocasia esculenta TaxID=4460 RepID=A0A843VJ60_COLES|nr:hypothetical protein [Colocasia esculenta]
MNDEPPWFHLPLTAETLTFRVEVTTNAGGFPQRTWLRQSLQHWAGYPAQPLLTSYPSLSSVFSLFSFITVFVLSIFADRGVGDHLLVLPFSSFGGVPWRAPFSSACRHLGAGNLLENSVSTLGAFGNFRAGGLLEEVALTVVFGGRRRTERGNKALAAMKVLGFPPKKTKPILKRLLRACENNWEHIEAENYRLLVETILDSDEAEEEDPKENNSNENGDMKKKKAPVEAPVDDEPELHRKRPRLMRQEGQQSSSSVQREGMPSIKTPKVERDDSSPKQVSPERNLAPLNNFRERNEPSMRTEPTLANTSLRQGNIEPPPLHSERQRKEVAIVSTQTGSANGRPKVHSVAAYERQPSPERVQRLRSLKESIPSSEGIQHLRHIGFKEPKIEPGLDSASGAAMRVDRDGSFTSEHLSFEVPLAIVHPQSLPPTRNEVLPSGHPERQCKKAFPTADPATSEVSSLLEAQNANDENGGHFSVVRNKSGTNDEVADVVKSSNNIEIASSTMGEAKVSLLYNIVNCPDFRVPSLESVLKQVEDRCLKSYKILNPSFSLVSIMKEVCTTVLELGTTSVEDGQEDPIRITPSPDLLKSSGIEKLVGGSFEHSSRNSFGSQMPQSSGFMATDGLVCGEQPIQKRKGTDVIGNTMKKKGLEVPEPSGGLALTRQHEPALGAVRPVHDVNDITKGEERVRVSIINEFTSEQFPPHFSYIPQNIVYQNAYMNFSLARIGDEDYCSDCFGDCLSASIPCACARETGGEFAYSWDGVLKKEFLDGCMLQNHDPQKDQMFYCKDCPLERSKNGGKPDACNGHLVRKFIKECWSKCGCNKQCGNRVVQRGITCNLQVFFTPEGKGWGLRTFDDLPRGAFVCEYVGEILTNMELYDRTVQTTGNARHTYPVLLDADWGSEGVLKDEEALCLDATFYGNVARFINHRCEDANLVGVPVEVETPDHHYYHEYLSIPH